MHLLPVKRDIDKAKVIERKREVDSGIALARSLDKLRETFVNEKKNLLDYRENTLKVIQQEIDVLLREKEVLQEEIVRAREERKQLIIPLDKEWEYLTKTKEELMERESKLINKEQYFKKQFSQLTDIVNEIIKNQNDSMSTNNK